jgi:hypothetical protein
MILAIRKGVFRLRRSPLLPVPRHPATARPPVQRQRRKRIWWALIQNLIAIDAVKLGLAPALGQAAAIVVSASRLSLRPHVVCLLIKGLEKRLQPLALRRDVVEAIVGIADVVWYDVCVAAQLCRSSVPVAGAIHGRRPAERLVDQAVQVVAASCSRHVEPRHEVLRVALAGGRLRSALSRRKAHDVDLDPLDGLLHVCKARAPRPLVRVRDEVVNLALVVVQQRLEVLLVQEGGALRAREDQVEVQEEAHPGPEGDPAEDEVEGVFDRREEDQHHEVDEPWCQLGGVRGVEGFVGGEDGEEDGGSDAGDVSCLPSTAGKVMG